MSKGFFFGKEKRHRKSAAEREREREVYLRTGRSPLSPVVCVCVRAPEKENVWWYESQKSRTDAALSKSAQSLILDERASAWIPLVIPPAYLHNRLFRALHLFLYGRSFRKNNNCRLASLFPFRNKMTRLLETANVWQVALFPFPPFWLFEWTEVKTSERSPLPSRFHGGAKRKDRGSQSLLRKEGSPEMWNI